MTRILRELLVRRRRRRRDCACTWAGGNGRQLLARGASSLWRFVTTSNVGWGSGFMIQKKITDLQNNNHDCG